MEQIGLKKLVKKELLHSVWLEIDKLVSNTSDLNRTQFGKKISGTHSWYSGALNEGEDIQLSSLVRILGQLSEKSPRDERIPLENIFSEKILHRGWLLSYLTYTKELESYLPEIIKQHKDIFNDIRNNLAPLYGEGRLGDNKVDQAYQELTEILQEMESENNG